MPLPALPTLLLPCHLASLYPGVIQTVTGELHFRASNFMRDDISFLVMMQRLQGGCLQPSWLRKPSWCTHHFDSFAQRVGQRRPSCCQWCPLCSISMYFRVFPLWVSASSHAGWEALDGRLAWMAACSIQECFDWRGGCKRLWHT